MKKTLLLLIILLVVVPANVGAISIEIEEIEGFGNVWFVTEAKKPIDIGFYCQDNSNLKIYEENIFNLDSFWENDPKEELIKDICLSLGLQYKFYQKIDWKNS